MIPKLICPTIVEELNFGDNIEAQLSLDYLSSPLTNLDNFFKDLKNREPTIFKSLTAKLNQLIELEGIDYAITCNSIYNEVDSASDISSVNSTFIALIKYASSPKSFFTACENLTNLLINNKSVSDGELAIYLKSSFGRHFSFPTNSSSLKVLSGALIYCSELIKGLQAGNDDNLYIALGRDDLISRFDLFLNRDIPLDQKSLGPKLFSYVSYLVDLSRPDLAKYFEKLSSDRDYQDFNSILIALHKCFATEDFSSLVSPIVDDNHTKRKINLLTESLESRFGVKDLNIGIKRCIEKSSPTFEYVREYHPSDPIKLVNWSAFARTGKPFTNSYSKEVEKKPRVILILDAERLDNLLNSSVRRWSYSELKGVSEILHDALINDKEVFIGTNLTYLKLEIRSNSKKTAEEIVDLLNEIKICSFIYDNFAKSYKNFNPIGKLCESIIKRREKNIVIKIPDF
jgi:Protein of unknown function DUF58